MLLSKSQIWYSDNGKEATINRALDGSTYLGQKIVHYVFDKINYGSLKHSSLYLGLVQPSGGRQSLIVFIFLVYDSRSTKPMICSFSLSLWLGQNTRSLYRLKKNGGGNIFILSLTLPTDKLACFVLAKHSARRNKTRHNTD